MFMIGVMVDILMGEVILEVGVCIGNVVDKCVVVCE